MGEYSLKTITDRAYVSPVVVGNCGDSMQRKADIYFVCVALCE